MRFVAWFAGGLMLFGCSRGGVVKVAEGHYEATCTSAGARYNNSANAATDAYAQCQKKAEELCGGPYDLKLLRSDITGAGSRHWQTRERYDIVCRKAGRP